MKNWTQYCVRELDKTTDLDKTSFSDLQKGQTKCHGTEMLLLREQVNRLAQSPLRFKIYKMQILYSRILLTEQVDQPNTDQLHYNVI